jgi:hypothetical protein
MGPVSRGRGTGRGMGDTDRVRDILAWPAMVLFWGLLLLLNNWPRWVPDLARFTRSAGFGQLHSAWEGWLDRNFELIENGAPWLDRAGSWVFDCCHTSELATGGGGLDWGSIPRPPPEVRCERAVTAVYGFDGSLRDRFAGLAAALAAAGWEEDDSWTRLGEVSRREEGRGLPGSYVERFRWSPVPGPGLPPGLSPASADYYWARKGLGSVEMGVGWISRGQPAGLLTTRHYDQPGDRGRTANLEWAKSHGWPGDLVAANAVYRPVEISGADVDELAGRAVARHEHAVAIRITAHYYRNAGLAGDRLRKRLRPVVRRLPKP